MNGYNDIIAEPSDDEDFATACGFEVITEHDLYNMISMSYQPLSSSSSRDRGNGELPSSKSTSSFASVASSGVSSIFKKPSSCSLSSQGSEISDTDDFLSAESGEPDSDDGVYTEDELQLSVENLWYMIQQKRHLHHDVEEETRMLHQHFLTMELASHHNHNRLTEWFANLIHFPEKLRQIVADKHRFNINKIPKEVRDELKHIYVY